jgi:hypothetical protein
MSEATDSKIYPMMSLRDIVVFPHMVAPLVVGRDKSIKALEKAMEKRTEIFLTTQKDRKCCSNFTFFSEVPDEYILHGLKLWICKAFYLDIHLRLDSTWYHPLLIESENPRLCRRIVIDCNPFDLI